MLWTSVASADVLLWQTGTLGGLVDATDKDNPGTTYSNVPWNYAVLKYTTDTEWSRGSGTILTEIVGNVQTAVVTPDQFDGAKIAAILPSEVQNAAYYFYVELYNENECVAHSDLVNYSSASLATYVAASQNASDWVGVNSYGYNPSNYTSVPEPSSGLMLLVGAALLSLRRKRRAV